MNGRPLPRTTPSRGRRRPGDRFGLLLLLLVITYVLSAFASGAWVTALQTALFTGVMLLALRTGHVPRWAARMTATLTLAGTTAAVALALTHSADIIIAVAGLWAALLLVVAVVIIVRRVLAHPEVTLQSIYGAVSAYMIIGLMFASVYGAMYRFGGDTFFASGSPGNINTFQYFSFTTLTTLGYGDFTAAGTSGRAVAVLEALAGQIFLATLIARLVASFRRPQRRGEQAPVNSGRRTAPHRPPSFTVDRGWPRAGRRAAPRAGRPSANGPRIRTTSPHTRGRPGHR
jgi:hypothetical protein